MTISSYSPGVVPLGAQAGQGAAGLGDKLVDHQQAVTAQLDQPAAALQLLGRHHLAALTEDGLPRRAGGQERESKNTSHTHSTVQTHSPDELSYMAPCATGQFSQYFGDRAQLSTKARNQRERALRCVMSAGCKIRCCSIDNELTIDTDVAEPYNVEV